LPDWLGKPLTKLFCRNKIRAMNALTPKLVHEVLKRFFPAKNDNFECDYVEELRELNDFGIATEKQLVGLLQKRVEEVMEIDRSPMTEFDIRMHSESEGAESVAKRLREGFWFSYPGLLRIALELEFGKSYKEYADKRDKVA
jgi:hypothetical protein